MASDDFTADDGTPIATNDPKWTTISVAKNVEHLEINNNLCEITGLFADGGAYYDDGQSDDTPSKITMVAGSNEVTDDRHVAVRLDSGGSETLGYAGGFASGDGSEWDQINVIKDGSFLAGFTSVGPWDYASDHTVEIKATGSTTVIIEVWVDDVSIGTKEDATSTITGGHPGMWTDNINSDLADSRMDNWTDGIGAPVGLLLPIGSLASLGVGR